LKRFTFLFLASWLYGDMNFEDLISKAINHHPSIQMSQEAFKMSEEELNSAKWQYFPTPSVDFSNSTKNDQVVAKLEQPIWTGGKLDSQYDIALSNKAESGYTLEESKYKLVERILNLIQAYSQGKSAEISLKEGYDRLSGFQDMIDRRVESGISSQSDKILLNSRLIQIKSDLVNAKSKKTLALKQLSLLIGENIENINFTLDKYNFDNNQSNLLIDDMTKFHPTLKKMDEQLKNSIIKISKEESALYPTISLVAEHKSGDVYTENTTESDNAIYLSLKATTGAGLSLFSNVEKAKLNTKRVKSEKDTKEQELIDAFVIDYNNMILAKEKLINLKQNLELSLELFESYKRLFIAGKKQWLDLVNSSKEIMDISVSYRDTKELYTILKYKIALQTGQINLEGLSNNDNEINIKPIQVVEQKNILVKNVTFGINEVKINEKFIPELQKLVYFMKMNKNYKLKLIGHSDRTSKSSQKYNQELSLKRAQNIANWLILNEIEDSRILVSSKGFEIPLYNNNKEGNELNRRVEFVVFDNQGVLNDL
jgi:adhesin transport system outer membrane protein